MVPANVERFFEKFLRPTIHACKSLGLPAEYKPINDVVVNNRKISGNGAGELDGSTVLVGNIILDFNYESMSRVLKVPSEKFRDKLAKSMSEWVTSLRRELGTIPPLHQIKQSVIEGYEDIGIKFRTGILSEAEEHIFSCETKPKHMSQEWLNQTTRRHPALSDTRTVRVNGTREVREATYKAKKMIRVTAEIASGRIADILIAGDFFIIPEQLLPRLERSVLGAMLDPGELEKRIKNFYVETSLQMPGIEPKDLVDAIMRLKTNSDQ